METRKSPVEVARQEFAITSEKPYYWVRLLKSVHNETLAEDLDTEAVRYSPADFPGLLYQPLFGNETFVFINRGAILVDLTSATAEEAEDSIDDLLSTLVARGVLDLADHTEIEAISPGQLSTDGVAATEEDGIDLTVSIPNIMQSMVRRPLFDPRDRLVVPNSDLTLLFDDLADGERIRYEYAGNQGFLELTASPDGATFTGIDTDEHIGFVFTRDRLRYQFETPESRFCSVSNSGAMILATSFTDATVVVYDETGTQLFETDIASIDGVTISPDGRQFGYAGHVAKLNQEVVVLCKRLDDGTVAQTTVTDYASVEYDTERGGFRVAEQSKDVFTALLAPDGTVIEEYDHETSRGNVNELLTRLTQQPTEDDDIVADIRVAVQEEPALFAPHVPSFVKRLADNEFPQGPTTDIPRLFGTLAKETPSAFEPTLDQLFELLERPDVGHQSESAVAVFQQLLENGVAQERIVERLHRLVATDDEDRQRRALQALQGIPAADLVGYEATLDQLLELLDREMPPKMMLPVTAVFSVHERQEGSAAIAERIVAADKTDVLVTLLRYGHNRRGDIIGSGVTFTISASLDDSETSSEEPSERNVALGEHELYSLNQRVATLLSTVASQRPDALVPHLGRLLLDVNTEGESMEVVRKNAAGIVETLVEQDPDGLEVAAERNADVIVELLNHDKARVGTLGVQLAALAGTERTQQEIQQIAETPSHQLWNDATDALDEVGSDTDSDRDAPDGSGGDSESVPKPLTRVAQFPVDPTVALSLPRPEDIERYRKDANKERSDIERRGEEAQRIHRSYIAALENGAVSPRLSVLTDVVFATTPDENVTAAFPTGPRIRARREELDVPRSELAEQAGCPDNRLRAIETNQADPQAHELERIVSALEGRDVEGAYPVRDTVREAWVEYGTALAEALGRFPKSREMVQDAEGNPNLTDADIGFNGSESVYLDVEIPEVPHWSVFDGWDELLAALDVDTEYRASGSPLRSTLIEELREIDEVIDGRPTTSDIDEHSEYSYHYYKKEFGGIRDAFDTADII